MNINTINSKKVFIFDVDGTLYSQPKMRLNMALRLGKYYALHFWKFKELLTISKFRKIRENPDFQSSTINEQITYASKKTGISFDKAKSAIDKWMFMVPLNVMEKCAFKNLLEFIRIFQKEGKELVIYSDYPAEQKLKKLKLKPSKIFTPENPNIGELKPSKNAMAYILKELNCPVSNIIYIGDRDCKDKASAEYAGIDYCDIKEMLRLIKAL